MNGLLTDVPLRPWLFHAGCAAFLLATTAVAPAPPSIVLAPLLAGLVCLVGLPHGALDPLVARRAGLVAGARGFSLLVMGYVAVAAAALAVWAWRPMLALVGFLALSAVHFAGDWRRHLPPWARVCGGVSIVTVPAILHLRDVREIFALLAGNAAAAAVVTVLPWLGAGALAGLLLAAIVPGASVPRARAEVLLVAASALALPPLLFFALYFCALHSPRHLSALARGTRRSAVVSIAIVFTLPAAAAGALATVFLTEPGLDGRIIQVTFIGLAALTVPHMLLLAIVRRRRAGSKPQTMSRWSTRGVRRVAQGCAIRRRAAASSRPG